MSIQQYAAFVAAKYSTGFTSDAYRSRRSALLSGRRRLPSRLPSLTNRRDALELSLRSFR